MKTMKTIQEKIAIMQAFAEGKPIELRNNRSGSEWKVENNPEWNWQYHEYRIKQDIPRTWEEFCEQHKDIEDEYYVATMGGVERTSGHSRNAKEDANTLQTREDAEGLLALIKLKRLRDVWVGDWKPNWKDDTRKFFICERPHDVLATAEFGFDTERRNLLSFPTREMAEDFLACFADLIKQAEMWL